MFGALKRLGAIRAAVRRLPFVPRSCPLCGSGDHRLVYRGDRDLVGLRTVQCSGCGFLFTNPYPPADAVDCWYRDAYRRLVKVEDPDAYARHSIVRERAGYYRRLIAGADLSLPQPLADIGCAEGALLATFARDGLTVLGVEPGERYRRFCREQHGIECHASLEELAPQSLGTAILVHVLEHVLEPRAFLLTLFERVREGGLLVVDVPDVEAYCGIEDFHMSHCNHFSARTLRALLQRTGFEVISITTHAPPTLPRSLHARARRRAFMGCDSKSAVAPDDRAVAKRIAGLPAGTLAVVAYRVRNRLARGAVGPHHGAQR